jgi:hypothetical protein
MKDRRQWDDGAVRDLNEEKGRFDLLPPFAVHVLAKHFQYGAKHYSDRNWENGIPLSVFMDSSLRHIFRFLSGEVGEDHLIAAAWNLMCAVDTRERILRGILPKKYDDLPYPLQKPTIKEYPHSGLVTD